MSHKIRSIKNTLGVAALVATLSLSVVTNMGCSSSSSGSGSSNTQLPLALFLAYQDGLTGSWQKMDTTWATLNASTELSNFTITDPSGIFSVLLVCTLRSATIAYLMQTSTATYSKDFFRCDNDRTQSTYNLSGTIGTAGDNFNAEVAIGNDFKNNWTTVASSSTADTNYNINVALYNGLVTTMDMFFRVLTYGLNHLMVIRDVDVSTNPAISYTPVSANVGVMYSPNITSYLGVTGYTGINVKLDMNNTKVLMTSNDLSATPSLEKLSYSLSDPDDIYVTYAKISNDITAGTHRSTITKLRNDPGSLYFYEIPNTLPGFSFSDSTTEMIRVEYDTSYDNGLSGIDDSLRLFLASKAGLEWKLYQTKDRFDTSISIAKEITMLDGWSSDWDVSYTDIKRITHYASDPATHDLLNSYLSNDKQADASHDGLDFTQVTFRPTF